LPVACNPVEAFINIDSIAQPYPPIFYRCYWQISSDVVQHEWSATTEFIEWYDANIVGNGNDVAAIISNLGGTPPGIKLIPLLKVTNHSQRF
jgi:hypothetical protein